MDVAARKRALRERIADQRRGRPPDEAAAVAAAARLSGMPEFQAAGSVALYAALPDELSTVPLYREARAASKRVALPRMLPGRRLEFAWVRSFDALRPGRYGVAEPGEAEEVVGLSELDLVVVPGVAFDRTGGRLGRGSGYYDRALASRSDARPFVVGLAEAERIVDEVPREAFDQRVDAVVTDHELLRTRGEQAGP